MTPENDTEQEVVKEVVTATERKECKQCSGRCKIGGIYRCYKKSPIMLDKKTPRYFEACESVNQNNDCADFKLERK